MRILDCIALAVATAGLSSCAPMRSDEALVCGDAHEPVVRKLKFSVDANGCVTGVQKEDGSDGNNFEVCRGDTLNWKVKVAGSNGDRKKAIEFAGGDSPCAWRGSGYKSDKIGGKVRPDADYKSYKYSVSAEGGPGDGCPLDPMIIVRP